MNLAALSNCIDERHEKAYEDITAGGYLDERLRDIGLKKSIRLIKCYTLIFGTIALLLILDLYYFSMFMQAELRHKIDLNIKKCGISKIN